MFRSRYISFNPHRIYIRHRHSKINKISSQISNERNVSEDIHMEDESGEELDETSSNKYNELESEELDDLDINEEVVDESLKSEQLPHTSGVFAPYFSNITEALMFCWVQKHNISTHAYDELADIIHHQQFENNYYSGDFVTYRKSSGSPKEIGHILAIVQQDNGLKIKIQRVLLYEDLPVNLQSNDRMERSEEGELWFLDREMDDATINIKPQSSSGFMSISQHLKRLMSDWFIAKDKKVNVMNDGNEDVNEAELALAYEDLEKYIISNNQPSFFEYASFVYIKESSEAIRYALHIGDVVSIDTDEFGEGLATHKSGEVRLPNIQVTNGKKPEKDFSH
ncbi:2431_t:CDS:2 [Rhizophagus irregularis]|nr:2431_t:CDS:2 [Rhizophagus irregularis]